MEKESEIQNDALKDLDITETRETSGNAELDAFLEKTMDGEAANDSEITGNSKHSEQNQVTPDLTEEDCAAMALKGLEMTLGMIQERTGEKIAVHPIQVALFTSLVTPCMMKHGPAIKNMISGMEIEQDSLMPEALAVGGVAVVAAPTVYQLKKSAKKKKPIRQKKAKEDAEMKEVVGGN